MRRAAILFAIGAGGGLIGDQGHVASGTTRYLDRGVPFIWESAFWFVLLVGGATVALGELRLRLAPPRPGGGWRAGVAAVAAVVGLYALTALLRDQPLGPTTALVASLAAVMACVLADGRPALTCGALAAVNGTVFEAVLVRLEVFEYAADIDAFAGVPPWLPALYFAFGVAAARLAELLTPTRA